MDGTSPPLHPELAALLPASLHGRCERHVHGKGAYLFKTGQKPRHMFFIAQGEVVLERLGMAGETVILQRTRQGFLGEASLQSARYHCDGKVVTPAQITAIPVQDIRAALESDPAFATRWIGMLNQEVRRLRMQCERLSLHRVQDRLLHLVETEGHAGTIPLGAGLKSLAGELGVTHEALYRCVAEMEKKGQLARDGGALTLHLARG